MLTCLYICIISFLYIKCKKKILLWKENRKMPRLKQNVEIIGKRINTTSFQIKGKKLWRDSITYHITFQLPNNEQTELCIPYRIYRFLFEGDTGKLTFQGTKFFEFERAHYEVIA